MCLCVRVFKAAANNGGARTDSFTSLFRGSEPARTPDISTVPVQVRVVPTSHIFGCVYVPLCDLPP